jgi:geranylgeranyl diphosphate synthase, type II
MPTLLLKTYLGECQNIVLDEIKRIVPDNRFRSILYNLMLEYPLRLGKAFRPSLCIAACRALGGRIEDVLPTAAVLEMYHNAFLVHDDVEDGSLMRRGYPTLHEEYGVPIAVNVGDGIFALCLGPLLDNMKLIGMGKSLHILETIARMARESVEGQAIELNWVRNGHWHLRDRDYALMAFKKTCWYTFITPMLLGGIIAGASQGQLNQLRKYGTYVGLAFQIQDDILNLVADEALYGKEIGGDLWEGKHTLMLLHMLRSVNHQQQASAQRILEKPRPEKTPADVEFLFNLVRQSQSIEYARQVAHLLAQKAMRIFNRIEEWMPPSSHRSFLLSMADYVITRDK